MQQMTQVGYIQYYLKVIDVFIDFQVLRTNNIDVFIYKKSDVGVNVAPHGGLTRVKGRWNSPSLEGKSLFLGS